MTDKARRRFYFPAWNDCCKANAWKMQAGRLLYEWEKLNEEGRKVLTFAQQIAVQENRPVALDDLRHGAHWLALGHDKSSKVLTNDELHRVVSLFKAMVPDSLERKDWDAYQRGENPGAADRTDWFIRNAMPEAYVRAVSLNKFGTRQWEWLKLWQKADLAKTLSQARRAKRKRSVATVLETAGIEQPF